MNKYVISGDVSEIVKIAEPIIDDRRFLSDEPNIIDFRWYPISIHMQAIDIHTTNRVDTDSIALLTQEFRSLTIAVLDNDDNVEVIYGDGKVVEV